MNLGDNGIIKITGYLVEAAHGPLQSWEDVVEDDKSLEELEEDARDRGCNKKADYIASQREHIRDEALAAMFARRNKPLEVALSRVLLSGAIAALLFAAISELTDNQENVWVSLGLAIFLAGFAICETRQVAKENPRQREKLGLPPKKEENQHPAIANETTTEDADRSEEDPRDSGRESS